MSKHLIISKYQVLMRTSCSSHFGADACDQATNMYNSPEICIFLMTCNAASCIQIHRDVVDECYRLGCTGMCTPVSEHSSK